MARAEANRNKFSSLILPSRLISHSNKLFPITSKGRATHGYRQRDDDTAHPTEVGRPRPIILFLYNK